MKVSIMGAAGFIGTNLALALLRGDADEIIGIDITELLLVDEKIEYFGDSPVKGDPRAKIAIRDFGRDTEFSDLITEGDVVFHLISTTNPTTTNQNISDELTVNIAVTVNLLEACAKKKASKVVFISSGGTVYGDATCPIPETASMNPITTYGIQKMSIEKLLYLYHYIHGLEYKIARLSNPYGPYQRPNGRLGAVTTFTDRAIRGEKVVVYGDGSVVRDYIYIDDAIRAVLNIAFCDCNHRVYNVGSGKGISINKIIDIIEDEIEASIDIEYADSRPVDLQENYLDTTRYQGEFGNISSIDIRNGIRETMEFLKNPGKR